MIVYFKKFGVFTDQFKKYPVPYCIVTYFALCLDSWSSFPSELTNLYSSRISFSSRPFVSSVTLGSMPASLMIRAYNTNSANC